jgi:hypothetical protein
VKGDSHTPQVMKAQMILAALSLAAMAFEVIGYVFRPTGIHPPRTVFLALALVLLLTFLATTLPFVRKAWRKDRSVACAAPLLLFGRAVALGVGYGWGVLAPRTEIVAG